MSHGLPSGYVRLYDDEGNPVAVRLTSRGDYVLAVEDNRARLLLEGILDELKKLNAKE